MSGESVQELVMGFEDVVMSGQGGPTHPSLQGRYTCFCLAPAVLRLKPPQTVLVQAPLTYASDPPLDFHLITFSHHNVPLG